MLKNITMLATSLAIAATLTVLSATTADARLIADDEKVNLIGRGGSYSIVQNRGWSLLAMIVSQARGGCNRTRPDNNKLYYVFPRNATILVNPGHEVDMWHTNSGVGRGWCWTEVSMRANAQTRTPSHIANAIIGQFGWFGMPVICKARWCFVERSDYRSVMSPSRGVLRPR